MDCGNRAGIDKTRAAGGRLAIALQLPVTPQARLPPSIPHFSPCSRTILQTSIRR